MSVVGGRLSWWLLAILASQFLVQLTVSMTRPVTSYRLLAQGADAASVGLVAAVFALPAMFLALSFGRWSDRRNPGVMLALGAGLTTVGAFALSRSTSVFGLAGWTALLGIGHLSQVVGAQSLIAYRFSATDAVTSFGLLTVSGSLGQMCGPLIGGWLAEAEGGLPTTQSTSLSLTVAALVGLAAVAVAAATVSAKAKGAHDAEPAAPDSAVTMLRTRGMPAVLLASFGSKGSTDLVTAFLPVLGTELGLGARSVGGLLSLSAGAAILARALMPWLVHRARTEVLLGLSTAISGACAFGLLVGPPIAALAGLMIVLGFLLALAQTVSMVQVASLASARSKGSALGMRLASNRAGQVAIPGLGGVISGLAGVSAAFGLLGVMMLSIGLVVLRSVPRGET